jgi:ankyrin repeat protein
MVSRQRANFGDLVQVLVDHGADINALDDLKTTELMAR